MVLTVPGVASARVSGCHAWPTHGAAPVQSRLSSHKRNVTRSTTGCKQQPPAEATVCNSLMADRNARSTPLRSDAANVPFHCGYDPLRVMPAMSVLIVADGMVPNANSGISTIPPRLS